MKVDSKTTHLSLFSGIGGFDLAAEWMGWNNIAAIEKDNFCQKVLKKNFPNIKIYDDVRTFPATNYTGRVDILTGGFPCQPFSAAGKRKGTSDDRHLWPEMLRVIREIKPTWVVAENVRGLISIEDGMAFEQVCIDLENEGYEVQPILIPACAVNAPHQRERIWFIGHSKHHGLNGAKNTKSNIEGGHDHAKGTQEVCQLERTDSLRSDVTDTEQQRPIQCEPKERSRPKKGLSQGSNWERDWYEVAAEFCSVDDGLPVELEQFKLSKSRHRAEQLKGYGNAIVPQIAYEIFKTIKF